MTATPEQTLNVTVAQVEDALLAGQTVPDFAREWSEPAANVLAIFRRLQREGRIPVNGPAQVATAAPKTRPLASVPSPPEAAASAQPSLDALVNAAARSTSKRTQALGVRLADLTGVVRQRLAEEREAAEKAEKDRRERDAAAAEVERLEKQLAEARKKLRPSGRGGSGAVQRESKPLSDARRAQIAKMREAARNTEPCANGCGYVAKTKAGKVAHETGSKCPGGAK